MNRDSARSVIAKLAAAFPGHLDREDTVLVWVEQLRAIDGEAAHVAATRLISELDKMPSIHQFIETAQEEARILASERQPALPRPENSGDAIYKCGTCLEGEGMVIDSREGRWTMHPCPSCNPDSYELWAGGHYAPDHDCPECKARRRGRKQTTKENA